MQENKHKKSSCSRLVWVLLAMCCLVVKPGVADPVTGKTAAYMVRGWLSASSRLGDGVGNAIDRVVEVGDGQSSIFFVVFLKPSGFVIVSADNWLEPVLGFSSGNDFEASPDNPLGALALSDVSGRMALISEAKKNISTRAPEYVPDVFAENMKKWSALSGIAESHEFMKGADLSDVRVEPLLRTSWNQGKVGTNLCYNYFTPNNYQSGCSATAMAQLMRYLQYPTNAVGTNSYEVAVDGVLHELPLRGRDGSGEPYYWLGMPYSPEESTSDAERRAIGSLCYDAGLAIASSYTISGTASYSDYVPYALTNTFFFRNAVYGYNNDANIGEGLHEMINPNLDAGNPLVLGIASSNSGHAVVCDGYGYDNGTIYHHINMGWGGAFDAWYNLPDVAGYTSVFACVYNVFADGAGEIVSGRVVNHAGAAMSGVEVEAAFSGGGAFTSVVTDTKGIYAFRNMASDSSFDISVSSSGHVFQAVTVTNGMSSNYANISGNRWGVDFVAGSTNPPSAPDGVNASDGTYVTKIRVVWNVVSGAENYEIWRSLSAVSNEAERVATDVSGLVYDDLSCEPGIIYYYWVVSTNNYGASGFSSPDYGWRALAASGGVSATDGVYPDKVAVTWSSVTNAQEYEVWRGTQSDAGLAVLIATVADTDYDDTDIIAGTIYYYRIKALNTNSTSGFSESDTGWASMDAELFPVYRLYSYGASESTFEHLWTMNAAERDVLDSFPSWQYEGVAWYAFASSTENSTPLYRLYAPSVRQHHYTINVAEYVHLSDADPAWSGEGVQYHVLAESSGDAVPVYRFYHAGLYLHHFTIDANEKNTIEANPQWGYEYEGIGFYVFPAGSGN